MFSPIKTAVTYIIVVLAITASACSANAQQTGKVPTIGYLHTDIAKSRATPGFFRGLRELGYVEGRNVTIVRRSAKGDHKRLREMAADLVRRKDRRSNVGCRCISGPRSAAPELRLVARSGLSSP